MDIIFVGKGVAELRDEEGRWDIDRTRKEKGIKEGGGGENVLSKSFLSNQTISW